MPRGIRIGHSKQYRVSADVASFAAAGSDAALTLAGTVTLSGPTSGATGAASTNFTVALSRTAPVGLVLTPTCSPSNGTFTPSTLSDAGTFTFTPSLAGSYTIGVTNNRALPTIPSSLPYTATGDTGTFIATVAGPNSVELHKPYTYTVSLNQPAPGSYKILYYQGTTLLREDSIKTGAFENAFKDVTFTSSAPETIDVVIQRSSVSQTHPLPTRIGSPITVTKPAATALRLLYARGGRVGNWVLFTVEPNGPVPLAFTVTPTVIEGATQTSLSTSSLTFAAGSTGRQHFWVYRHSAGQSRIRIYNSSAYPTVDSDLLIFGDGSWNERTSRPNVLAAHNFTQQWEVDQFCTAVASGNGIDQLVNPPVRELADIGYVLATKAFGSTLVEDVPSCLSYVRHTATPDVARQVWKVADASDLPQGPFPYQLIIGSPAGSPGACLEWVRIESINTSTNEVTLLRRISGESFTYAGVPYPGGSGATNCPALPGDGTVTIGIDSQGAWERHMCALRIQGIRDDEGITNGSARKIRDWPPINRYGTRVTNPPDRSHTLREGYWGHKSYWDPAYGAAEFKDWLPPDESGGDYFTRTDAFEGDEIWIQLRSRVDSQRLQEDVRKHFFVQNATSGSGQFYWGIGRGGEDIDTRPIDRGNVLTGITSFGSEGTSIEPPVLTTPPGGGLNTRYQHQESYPNCIPQSGSTSAVCWRFPPDKWVTYMLHFKFGRDNAPVPYTTGSAAEERKKYNEPAALDYNYRTTLQLFVAEEGDLTWTRITDYDRFAWVFGDYSGSYGFYSENPPGLSLLQLQTANNLYIGRGSTPPPSTTTKTEFADIIFSRDPLPIPNVGTMPSDYQPDAVTAPTHTPALPTVPTGHYSDGMLPFEVRLLTGAYAPVSADTLQGIEVPPWNSTSGVYGIRGRTEAWSGGDSDYGRKRTYFAGGGHSDGNSNGVYYFDWSGTDKPVGFKMLQGSRSEQADIPTLNVPELYYPKDGLYYPNPVMPGAPHTYALMPYDPVRDRIYMGWFWVFGFDISPTESTSGEWNLWVADVPDLNGDGIYDPNDPAFAPYEAQWGKAGSLAIPSPDGNQIFNFQIGGGGRLRFLDADTGAVTIAGNSPAADTSSLDLTFGYDSLRDRYLVVGSKTGDPPRVWLLTLNWAAKTRTLTTVSNATHNASNLCGAMAMVYDELLDCFWCVGGKNDANVLGQFNTIYRVNAQTFDCVAFTLSELVLCNCKGQYRRFYWMADKRCIGLITSYQQPAVLIKVPNS